LILKGVQVVCFDTLLQVLILNRLEGCFCRRDNPLHRKDSFLQN
jgi:hypothetical protein